MNVQESVSKRYSQGALQRVEALCCPIDYDRDLLAVLPEEIIERDYGCGDPSRYVRAGDTVLDLGSGGGKICYMAAQLVGTQGRVVGIDMNDDMLALARRYQAEMAQRLGGDRVSFHKGYIQDLALDLHALQAWLQANPVTSGSDFESMRSFLSTQRRTAPLIPDASIDLVISNCVLNLVEDADKQQLVTEIFRVLKPGGRIAISDIVSDQPATEAMKRDPELWSGCISGAFTESGFLQAFRQAGFSAVCYDKWEAAPWQVIDAIEFRSVTLTAIRPPHTDSTRPDRIVLYRGPFASVTDEHGNVWQRGQRYTVPAGVHAALAAAYPDAFVELPAAGAGERIIPVQGNCCGADARHGSCC